VLYSISSCSSIGASAQGRIAAGRSVHYPAALPSDLLASFCYVPLACCADVGGLLFDKDAVYIDIPDWKVGLPLGEALLVGRCNTGALLMESAGLLA